MNIVPHKTVKSSPIKFEIIDENNPSDKDIKAKYKSIAQTRQECFEYRMSWYEKYKKYTKKEQQTQKYYDRIIERQNTQEKNDLAIAQKLQSIEKRKEKLQQEKQKLEEMREKENNFEIKEIMAIRRMLKEQTSQIDFTTIADFSRRSLHD